MKLLSDQCNLSPRSRTTSNGGWRFRWHRRLVRAYMVHAQFALCRKPERSVDVRCGRGFASARRARRVLHPRVPRNSRRPHGRVEIRIAARMIVNPPLQQPLINMRELARPKPLPRERRFHKSDLWTYRAILPESRAIGMGAIRFSLGRTTTREEMEQVTSRL